ncbi:MAG TPA: glycosyl transferase [Bacteroidia bacterium]|nr:glycosyl transferase [Bacteroidia bacterium]
MNKKQYNYVTLFNLNYLNRGLVLYDSLIETGARFRLFVVCFDEDSFRILTQLNLPHLIPVSLGEFEDEKLLSVKSSRSATEYCWTCSASVVWYCMRNYNLSHCAYIDADLYFYTDPASLWEENPGANAIISLHNYSPEYDQSEVSGKFCVQFVGFNSSEESQKILLNWRENCITWCYNRVEDGKFGDQKYLDAWPQTYASVHILNNPTAGLAPWNIQQFSFMNSNKVRHNASGRTYTPVFYHFHKLRVFKHDFVSFTAGYYSIDQKTIRYFYLPYARKLLTKDKELKAQFPSLYAVRHEDYNPPPFSLFKWLKHYLYYLRRHSVHDTGVRTRLVFYPDYTYKIK